jgi:hypothetical protein
VGYVGRFLDENVAGWAEKWTLAVVPVNNNGGG